ncbi:MAG: DEAD/DEAH box helicase family protein [Candidatus Omnitrophota bacterium]
MLRKHQQDFDQTITGIINGSGVTTIVAHCTPGGGKSTLPIQAGRLITAGLADRICWIAPRASLQDQAERNFIDARFRQMFGHNLTIRSSTNQMNPSRGLAGWVSTYQALAVDDQKTALRDFEMFRYILVLDEFHHLAADGEWTEPIKELYERAAFRVLMTGTLARGDEKKIAFVPYSEKTPGEFVNDFKVWPSGAIITYTRKDALADHAIIPLEFHFADGVASWRKESGRETTANLSTGRGDANQALYTALKTEYAQELLAEGVKHWQDHPKGGSLLVVAASIESAKEYTALLKRQGLHAAIATSDDTPEAVKQIKALKAGKLKILVTVAMAYEGLDVPSISHIICLTNVRSMPWIEQMVARAVRIDPLAGPYETQRGYIFAPADRMFTELATKIESDQTEAVALGKKEALAKGENGELFEGGEARPRITPLSSKLLHSRQQPIYQLADASNQIMTNREKEENIRGAIKRHIGEYSFNNRMSPKQINYELFERFGKPREQMTLLELEAVLTHVKSKYALSHIRGAGHPRVPAKATPYQCAWR